MDSVVSNLCALASSRLSRSSDLTQGRKVERDAKLREMRPRFFGTVWKSSDFRQWSVGCTTTQKTWRPRLTTLFASLHLCALALNWKTITQRRKDAMAQRTKSLGVFHWNFRLCPFRVCGDLEFRIGHAPYKSIHFNKYGKTQSSVFLKDMHKNLNLCSSVLICG